MQALIYSFVAVVLLSLVVELFCPTKHMKNVTMAAFSLVTIFIIISGLKNLITNEEELNFNLNEEITYSLDSISASSVKNTETQLKNLLKVEGIDNVYDVELEYELNEYNIIYTGVKIMIDGSYMEEKVKEIVSATFPEISKEDIIVI